MARSNGTDASSNCTAVRRLVRGTAEFREEDFPGS